jgi:hypothetical protein
MRSEICFYAASVHLKKVVKIEIKVVFEEKDGRKN